MGGVAAPVVAEFWGVVAHPSASGRPSTPKEAQRFLAALADAGAHVWSPRHRIRSSLGTTCGHDARFVTSDKTIPTS